MATLESLLDRRDPDAAVAWAATAVTAGAAGWFLLAGEPDWSAVAVLLVAVALVPPAVTRDPTVTLPGELLVLAAVPVVVRAAGWFPAATPFLAVAGLALLSVIVLEAFTSLRMTPRFAVVFVVVTTLAFAGVWTVGTWTADAAFGTTFIEGSGELMWDLVTAAGMGVLAGIVLEAYFAYSDRIDRLERAGRSAGVDDPSIEDLPGDAGHHRIAARGMQALLVVIAAWAVLRGEVTLVINSAVPLAVTFLPAILRHEYDYPMDAGLTLWVTLVAALHAVGALGPYEAFGWYDSLTHAVSATLVAGVGYAIARSVELHTAEVRFDPRFRAAFVVLFVLAVGVLWEIVEFGTGGIAAVFGGEPVLAQYGVDDIVNDLVFDAAGALVVAAGSSRYFERAAHALAGRVEVLVRGH